MSSSTNPAQRSSREDATIHIGDVPAGTFLPDWYSDLLDLVSAQITHGHCRTERTTTVAWPERRIVQGALAQLTPSHTLVQRCVAQVGRASTQGMYPGGQMTQTRPYALLDEFQRIDEIEGQQSANVLTAARPRRELIS